MLKPITLMFVILTLAGCVSQADFGEPITDGEPTPIPTQIIPSRQLFEVARGDIVYQQTYFGRISAVTTNNLIFPHDGRILEVLVARGDDVVTGDILATLDTTDLEAELLDAQEVLAVAQSLLDSAESQATFARRRAELNIELAQIFLDSAMLQAQDPPTAENTLLISQREIELQVAQLALDELDNGINPELQFDVSRAQEEVDRINEQIAQSELIAPMDGQLITLSIEPGDPVIAFETVGVVADISTVEITGVLESSQLSELNEGMPVTMQRANTPGETFTGTIALLPQPFGSGNDEAIHIRFDNQDDATAFNLGDRMSFVVTIEERDDVLWLPPAAIRQFSGRNFVVVQDGTLQQRFDVTLGLESDSRVEIVEGLEEGQTVIAP